MTDSNVAGMDTALNTRVDPRYPASAVPSITSVRLSPGDTVTLINISASGVLVEGTTRFVPGTRVTVHFEGAVKPSHIKARVVRCQVSSIGGAGSLQYQSAIAFEGRVELRVSETAQATPPPAPADEAPAKKGKSGAASQPASTTPKVVNRW